MILEPLYYVSYATLVWGDLGFINFVDNTHLGQNQMAWLQWGRIRNNEDLYNSIDLNHIFNDDDILDE